MAPSVCALFIGAFCKEFRGFDIEWRKIIWIIFPFTYPRRCTYKIYSVEYSEWHASSSTKDYSNEDDKTKAGVELTSSDIRLAILPIKLSDFLPHLLRRRRPVDSTESNSICTCRTIVIQYYSIFPMLHEYLKSRFNTGKIFRNSKTELLSTRYFATSSSRISNDNRVTISSNYLASIKD